MPQDRLATMMAGTIAGWAMVTVGQPLDYIKTQYQVRTQQMPSIRQIYQNIGLKGFYKGASSIYLFIGFVTALQFQTFQTSTKYFGHMGFNQNGTPNGLCLMMAGFMTGAVCSFIYTPTQYAKIHCQIEEKRSMGSVQRIYRLITKEKLQGIRKLYTGHSITLGKQSLGSAIYYGGYHLILAEVLKQKRENAELWTQIVSGGVAGILYQLYSYPIDTIKTNIQSGRSSLKELISNKFWRTLNFRSGLRVSLIRSFIVDATNFSIYENARKGLYHVSF